MVSRCYLSMSKSFYLPFEKSCALKNEESKEFAPTGGGGGGGGGEVTLSLL